MEIYRNDKVVKSSCAAQKQVLEIGCSWPVQGRNQGPGTNKIRVQIAN